MLIKNIKEAKQIGLCSIKGCSISRIKYFPSGKRVRSNYETVQSQNEKKYD